MKKPLKITLISIGSLLGLVIVAVLVACWLIFTPARLTSIVNSLAEKYVHCESDFEKVDLTLFKTFPNVGLDIQNVRLVNPTEGALSDTLMKVDDLTVSLDLKAFLSNGDIKVRGLEIDNVTANLFTDKEGHTNFDIFPPSTDTTKSEFELPEIIDIEKVAINNLNATYRDLKNGVDATLQEVNLAVKGTVQHGQGDVKLTLDGTAIAASMKDSSGADAVKVFLSDLDLSVDGKGTLDSLNGRVKLQLPEGKCALKGVDYITDQANSHADDLLSIDLPFAGSWTHKRIKINEAELALAEHEIDLDGTVALPHDTVPTMLDLCFETNKWNAPQLVSMLPPQFVTWKKGMQFDADLELKGRASGLLGNGKMPLVVASLQLDKGAFSHKSIPYKLNKIAADIDVTLDLAKGQPSKAVIKKLDAYTGKNHISVAGKVDDLLGDIAPNATVRGNIALADLQPILPKTLSLTPQGNAELDIAVRGKLSNLATLKDVQAQGSVRFEKLDVRYDSIHVASPQMEVDLKMPADKERLSKLPSRHATDKLAATITSGKISLQLANSSQPTAVDVAQPNIVVALSDFMNSKQPLAAAVKMGVKKTNVRQDSLEVDADSLNLAGCIRYDAKKKNILQQLDPDLTIDLRRTSVYMPSLPEAVRLSSMSLDYTPKGCAIRDMDILWGTSDYHLAGNVENLEKWLSGEGLLLADLKFTSNYTDVDQLMTMLSGMGSDPDTLKAQMAEAKAQGETEEAAPFIVPKNMNVTLHTHIKRCVAFSNPLNDLAGDVTINDGVAVLDQIGFVCKAARMQLTAVYKSPRRNHLFAALDFHLLDIQIDELIDMIPSVDTLVPMLASFKGNANFHLAVETYLNSRYQPKLSSMLGSAAISGKDLVVLDNETFDKIATLLLFKKKTENKIDSLDVEMTLFQNELELYPFLLTMDKYQVCASGRHSLDNRCNYHLELLKSPLPVRLAVDVKGSIKKPKIELGKVQYAEMYKPEKQNQLQNRVLAIKKLVRESLEKNVKINLRK